MDGVDGIPVAQRDLGDTVGAGDAFCGALAAALADGAGPRAALDAANEAGAAAVRWVGAQPDAAL
jgi:ribokinase